MPRPEPLTIPAAILDDIYRRARAAYPRECCGWLAGPRDQPAMASVLISCSNAQRDGEHPTEPARPATSAYCFAGDELVAFALSFAGALPARVLFHSHPNGRAELSQVGIDNALAPGPTPLYPVQQLVVAIDDRSVRGGALFAWWQSRERFTRVADFAGAAW